MWHGDKQSVLTVNVTCIWPWSDLSCTEHTDLNISFVDIKVNLLQFVHIRTKNTVVHLLDIFKQVFEVKLTASSDVITLIVQVSIFVQLLHVSFSETEVFVGLNMQSLRQAAYA